MKILPCLFALIICAVLPCGAIEPVYMANGIKIGEVDSDSAIIWTRLTKSPERVYPGKAFIQMENQNKKQRGKWDGMNQIPEGLKLSEMDGAVPGVTGEVKLTYWPEENKEKAKTTGWQSVDPNADYTKHFKLKGLTPWTRYELQIEGRPNGDSDTTVNIQGGFITAPTSEQAEPVTLAVVTCGDYDRRDDDVNGHKIYKAIKELHPDFFVHTGDIEYYDKPNPWAPSPVLARFKMTRLYSLPYNREMHMSTASYFMKDDHDITKNDAWPGIGYGKLSWDEGLAIYDEQFPMGEKPYRTIRWGKDLQIWLMEGRNYRTPNMKPDGPDKSIWGQEQKQWFFDTVKASDATFKLLISPTPIVGPDRINKKDNHANKVFEYEGNQVREFVADQKNMYIVNGDRHWQYHTIDDVTGIHEFSCGAHTNSHAGGFNLKNKTPEHQFLRVKGGFLTVDVSREDGEPTIAFRHRDVDGNIVNEEMFTDS